jgi:cytochrome c551/c552
MLLFHLPYMGTVLVSAGMSVLSRKQKPQLSDDFINLAMGKSGIWIAFGLLPAVSLAVLYRMLLFNAAIPIHYYLTRILLLQVAGMVLLWLYRRTSHIILGAGGTLLILLYCFHFVNLMAFLVFPEKWPFHKTILPYPLFAITPLVHFGAFLFLSLIVTGAAILFIYYKWTERQLPEDSPNYKRLKYFGFGFLLAGSLSLPLMIFWDLLTLPNYALSISVFVLSGLSIIVLFLLVSAAAAMIRSRASNRPRLTVSSLVLAIILFGLFIGKDRALQANANLETMAVLEMDAQKVWDEAVSKREEIYAKTAGIDPKKGEEIFNQVCTACHGFAEKKLGPPLNSVLPKYAGKENELIEYIKNPTRVDPQYPAMPNPGLTTFKIKSIVKFLMEKNKPGENSE